MKTVYIAHPLGAGPDRSLNLERAARWAAWAALQGVAPSATWIVLASVWAETDDKRELGLACDVASACACMETWLCGPRISPGMLVEANGVYSFTQYFPVPESHSMIWDLTYAGLIEPPATPEASAALLAGKKRWAPSEPKAPPRYIEPPDCATCGGQGMVAPDKDCADCGGEGRKWPKRTP